MAIALEQFQGCLLGLAAGDAVAAKWEGMTTDLIYEMGPADEIVRHSCLETIYYTDDTQMTIGVVEALLENGEIEPDALAQRFASNYDPNRGYGQGARKIINAIGFGEDWKSLAATIFNGEGSLGNGAAMRVAPIGIFFASDLDKVAEQARLSAAPTHTHPIGVDGARLIAVSAALAATTAGAPFNRTEFFESLRPFSETEEFQWQISHALQLEPFQSLVAFGNSLEAHRSVMTSIVCFADSPDDYSAAIARAIGQGDDVDTLAAMTGALVGSRLGLSGVPQNLQDCLENGVQGRDYLIQLAERLHAAATTS